jgi:hypothetical protein
VHSPIDHLAAQENPIHENPNPAQQAHLQSPFVEAEQVTPEDSTMAYQRADPGPFFPNGMHRLNVPRRVPMVRAVARSRPQRWHETVAIVNINPLPDIAMNFQNVRPVLEEFFVERNIGFSDIQSSHLGQALVYFNPPIDRDALVLHSPLPMGNVQVSFTRHNQGRN